MRHLLQQKAKHSFVKSALLQWHTRKNFTPYYFRLYMSFKPISENAEVVQRERDKILELVRLSVKNRTDYCELNNYLQIFQTNEDEKYKKEMKKFFYEHYSEALWAEFLVNLELEVKKIRKKELGQLVNGTQEIDALENFFPSLEKLIPLMKGCLEDKLFDPGKILGDIWKTLNNQYERIRVVNIHENDFLLALKSHVNCLLTELNANSISEIPLIQNSPTISDLIKNIKSITSPCASSAETQSHNALRSKMHKLLVENSDQFRTSFQRNLLEPLMNEYRSPPEIEILDNATDKDHKVLKVNCCGININRLKQEMQKIDVTLTETRVYATNLFVVDSDFSGIGANFTVSSPKIKILHPETVLDVSGIDASNACNPEKAEDGANPGASGAEGVHGYHGMSGGNVTICCDEIEGASNLKIISNGGNGGDGQNGGNGRDGKSGKDGKSLNCKSQNDFLSKFGKLEYIDDVKKLASNLKPFEIEYDDSSYFFGTKSDLYFQGKYESMKTTLIHYRYRGNLWFRTLVLVKGLPGTDGSQGGNAGAAGAKGEGGYPGIVEICGLKSSNCIGKEELMKKIEAFPGKDGKDGFPGKPGNGGRNGNKGADCGRVEANREQFVYFGVLELYDDLNETKRRVWSGKSKKYFGIQEVGKWPLADFYKEHGKKAIQRSNKRQKVRKRLIVRNEINQEMKQAMKKSPHVKIGALFQQEQKEEVKAEEHVQENEVTKTHRIQSVGAEEVKQKISFTVPKKRKKLEDKNFIGVPPFKKVEYQNTV